MGSRSALRLTLCAFLLAAHGADAGENASPATVEEATSAVLAALAAGEPGALATLALRDRPDPWLVADDLLARGEADASLAFARAAPRTDTDHLAAYVEDRRGRPPEAEARMRLREARAALDADRPADALLALSSPDLVATAPVLRVLLADAKGLALTGLGRWEGAAPAWLEGGVEAERVGWLSRAASSYYLSGTAAWRASAFGPALDAQARCLAVSKRRGDDAGVAKALNGSGIAHMGRGDHAQALGAFERALAVFEASGDRGRAAIALGNIGNVHHALGDHATALSLQRRALDLRRAAGDGCAAASTLGNIGNVLLSMGDPDGALAAYEQALGELRALEWSAGIAGVLGDLAKVHAARGDHERALGAFEEALLASEEARDPAAVTDALLGIGSMKAQLGRHGEALAALGRALDEKRGLGDKVGVAVTLGEMAACQLAAGDAAAAVVSARQGIEAAADVGRGVDAELGTSARESLARLYDAGVSAAWAHSDAGEMLRFLEAGRAGALVEGLRARETLWTAAIPATLRSEEERARGEETRANAALRAAIEGGDRAAVRTRRAELEAAQVEVARVVGRIQREAKAGASLTYPELADLPTVTAALRDGEVLVLFGLLERSAYALVISREAARIVDLGGLAAVEAAVGALDLASPEKDPTAALARLRALLIDPLGLPARVSRVLISPAGRLAQVPFGALRTDLTFSHVPSATTWCLLREEAGLRGEGVLALGDPAYGARSHARAVAVHRGPGAALVPLPATRAEAVAVGTRTLLGAEATEEGLATALALRPRWRAVHLACHGLVNLERPALSSLAITAAGADDGFLTCLDVFRMRIPADLVVLSACETGRGKIVRTEGLVGFARAFMFAGAPRVIASLWKVDDEATAALMRRFYERWNPPDGSRGLPTAEALREAQAFVRAQGRWRHPHYWAAWVLSGLPD